MIGLHCTDTSRMREECGGGFMKRMFGMLGACAVLTAILAVVGPAWGANASTPMPYSIQPLKGAPGTEEGYYDISASPGAQVKETLVVSNRSSKTIKVLVAATDAATGPHGGVSYNVAGEPVTKTGTWIVLPQDSIRLQGGQRIALDFVINVPVDASPGDHVAAVSAWIPADEKDVPESGSGQAGASITVQMRQVVPVKVVVPGPAATRLVVTGVSAVAGLEKMDLDIAIANPGGLLTRGDGVITLPNDGFERDFELGTVVPGTAIAYSVPWKTAPKAGTYPVQVVLRYGDAASMTAEWAGDVTVADKNLAELENRQAADDDSVAAESASSPWLMYGLIGGLVVVIIVMGVLLMRRRRPAPKA